MKRKFRQGGLSGRARLILPLGGVGQFLEKLTNPTAHDPPGGT
ncbi:hypothetical protein JOF55_002372 [Haloactinomyces albus]|uniref:Uncharacterized protein n=1 Tax=Haloactinomyces albus TaxID=1352928 RepID=A0AAE3ZE67_9ACTN|nr:hypothetical protein [Haloactinomyces albus]